MKRNYIKETFIFLLISGLSFSVNGDEKSQTLKESNSMYSIFVTMHVKPESINAFKDAMIKVAEGSVNEPDCFRYEVMTDKNDSTIFYIFEVFRDKEAHSKHTKTKHFKDWWNSAGHLLYSKMKIIMMNTLFPSVNGFESQKPGLVN